MYNALFASNMRQQFVDIHYHLLTQDGWQDNFFRLGLLIYSAYGDFYIVFFGTWFLLANALVNWIKNDLFRHIFCAMLGYYAGNWFVVALDNYLLKNSEISPYQFTIPKEEHQSSTTALNSTSQNLSNSPIDGSGEQIIIYY